MLALLCGAAGLTTDLPRLTRPVDGPVVAGFVTDGLYGPGHRGLDLRAPPGTPVVAPAAGRITFAGPVAGRRWVSVAPAPSVLVTVGPMDTVLVRRGDVVAVGTLLGTVGPGHDGTLHLSLRVDGVHVDPAPLLLARGPLRASLLPLGVEGVPSIRHAVAGAVPHARLR